jgi:hypothetical protein
MPHRCLDDAGRSLDALALTTVEWVALTATNRHVRHLEMHCCGSPVVLKTSRLGTRFFAHHALGGCASEDESAEHLHLKALAITAARAAGWEAEAEAVGATPDGEPWRADARAAPRRGRGEWSGQADAETARRQARYAASAVRALWLFRRPGFAVDPDVPAVRVRGSLTSGLTVLGLPAADFLDAVFDRRLRFGLPAGAVANASVGGAVTTCWGAGCGALARVVDEVVLVLGGSVCTIPLAAFGADPAVLAAVVAALPVDPLRGRIRVRRSDGAAVVGCFRCDRPLTPRPGSAGRSRLAAFALTITPAWAALIAAQSGYAAVWSIVPVASAPVSA